MLKQGYLVRTESTSLKFKAKQQRQLEELSNYKDVNGVMMPFTQKITAGPQIITFNVTRNYI